MKKHLIVHTFVAGSFTHAFIAACFVAACSSGTEDVGVDASGAGADVGAGGWVSNTGGAAMGGSMSAGGAPASGSAANGDTGGVVNGAGGVETGSGGIETGSGGSAVGGTGGTVEQALRCNILDYGAKGDGSTLNTKAIQAAIDACAAAGGGTLVVPQGRFVTGALFLKLHVDVELANGAVLAASKNIKDFPIVLSRFEGHFQDRPASLLNAEKLDGLKITGPGTLDGNGAAFWSADLPQGRPKLVFIRDSKDVTVSAVKFKNSPSWNLHLYNCQDVLVESSRFEIDPGASGPSTDGTDIDSCQNVTVRGCYCSVNDDCVVLKGNRYDGLNQSPASPPVSNIHVTDCTFVRGKGALSLGTEAQYIHDVEFDNSKVSGDFPTLRIKMRPDTSGQRYENINVHDIELDGTDDILGWELTRGTAVTGTPPPHFIKNITVSDVTGKTAAFGNIAANATTEVNGVTLSTFNVTLTTPTLTATGVKALVMNNVVINGKLWSATANNGQPGPVK